MTGLTGRCACGKVRFSADGAPKFAFFCQCTDCQKLTGSGNAAQFCHAADQFSWTGTPSRYDRQNQSGHTVAKYFCSDCGCPLWGTTSRADTIVMVMAGALDDPAQITPDRIFFADEAQPWDTVSLLQEKQA